ncbi:hypothetical protein LCGC14_0955330 [marine sediment metagenome]|uniref:Uncharacterized protein n=1 Tax=marine sediment metagenome TaxID=412755 RepID=A0A0F9NFZ0_9ZZZZ
MSDAPDTLGESLRQMRKASLRRADRVLVEVLARCCDECGEEIADPEIAIECDECGADFYYKDPREGDDD